MSLGTTSLKLSLADNLSVSHSFVVIPRSFPIPYDGIIGKDFIWKYKCTICANFNRFTIRCHNQIFHFPFNNSGIWLPPRSQCIRKINVNLKNDKVLRHGTIRNGIFAAGAIISAKNPHVLLLNTTDKPVVLRFDEFTFDDLADYDILRCKQTNVNSNMSARVNALHSVLNLSKTPSKAKNDLKNLCEEFNDIFFIPGDKLSVNNFYEQEIRVSDSKPVFRKNYRIPESQKNEVKEQITKMLRDDIIEPSDSPYNSPIFLVPKKSRDGSKKFRLVVDFRDLNTKVEQDRFPLPRIEEVLDSLGSAKYFSTLDLYSGFHQVPLENSSRKYTAFSTQDGHWQYTRLPFGLNLSPNSFQRMITIALSGLPSHVAFLYIDDIIVVGGSENHHLENLRKVFAKLRQRGLKLNPEKCDFFRTEVTFLGHKIAEDGVYPDPEKIKAVKEYPVPRDAAEVKRFVAFANYYRKFVKNFSVLAAPLHEVCRTTFVWNKDCQKAFEALRDSLIKAPILKYPDFSKEFIVTTDASDLGCGAKLAQVHNSVEMPVAFASMAFKGAQLNAPPIEKEMYGIYFAITQFRPYLFGRKFLVRTDHKPLVHLYTMKNPSPKILRMRLDLSEYDFDIEYLPGKDNVEADALSRIHFNPERLIHILAITRSMTRKNEDRDYVVETKESSCLFQEPLIFEALNPVEARALPKLRFDFSEVAITYSVKKARSLLFNGNHYYEGKLKRDVLASLLREVETKAAQSGVKKIALQMDDEIFKYVTPSEFKDEASRLLESIIIVLYLPRRRLKSREEIEEVLKEFHNSQIAGHPGQQRMFEKLKRYYVWKKMKSDIKEFVNACKQCKLNKHSPGTKEKFTLTATPAKPFDLVAMDTVGPLPTTSKGNKYIVSMQCNLSKFVIYACVADKTAKTIARAIVENLILVFGPVKQLISDAGTEYVNEVLSSICELLGIERLQATAAHPETIGSLERNHRVLNDYLRTTLPSVTDWDEYIKYYSFAYNTTPVLSHGLTPFSVVFGREANLPSDLGQAIDPLYNYDSYMKEIKYKMQCACKVARDNLLETKNKMLNNQTGINPILLEVGDKVKVNNLQRENKLSPLYVGPFTVVKVIDPNVELIDSKNKKIIVHKNRVNKF